MNKVMKVVRRNISGTLWLVGILVYVIFMDILFIGTNSLSRGKPFGTAVDVMNMLFPLFLLIFIPLENLGLLTNRSREMIEKGVTRKTFWKSMAIINVFQIIYLVVLRLVLDYFSKKYFNMNSYELNGNYFLKCIIYIILFSNIIVITDTICLVLAKRNFILPDSFIGGSGGVIGVATVIITRMLLEVFDIFILIDVLNNLLSNFVQISTVIGAILIGILSYVNYKLILQIDAR